VKNLKLYLHYWNNLNGNVEGPTCLTTFTSLQSAVHIHRPGEKWWWPVRWHKNPTMKIPMVCGYSPKKNMANLQESPIYPSKKYKCFLLDSLCIPMFSKIKYFTWFVDPLGEQTLGGWNKNPPKRPKWKSHRCIMDHNGIFHLEYSCYKRSTVYQVSGSEFLGTLW
jgi:hypothetical protein